jgi:hypothetical protein
MPRNRIWQLEYLSRYHLYHLPRRQPKDVLDRFAIVIKYRSDGQIEARSTRNGIAHRKKAIRRKRLPGDQ